MATDQLINHDNNHNIGYLCLSIADQLQPEVYLLHMPEERIDFIMYCVEMTTEK